AWARYVSFSAVARAPLYPLSLHDALPIWFAAKRRVGPVYLTRSIGGILTLLSERSLLKLIKQLRTHISSRAAAIVALSFTLFYRSEEHTSELQSRVDLVCRLLLEKNNLSF